MSFSDKNIILRISDLTISDQGNKTVKITDNLSFDVERSKITGLVGVSGSGKTLTAYSILGLTRYLRNISVRGSILFNDSEAWHDMLKMTESELAAFRGRKIAFIMQDPVSSFDPNKKCGKQLAEIVNLINRKAKDTERNIEELMVKMNLDKRTFNAYPHQLSGGELQRFAILMAITAEPDLIIADEPVTNLDQHHTQTILDILRDINREKGVSVLFISHDLRSVRSICDNVAIIKEGKLAEFKSNHDFFHQPENPFSRQLTDAFFNFALAQKTIERPLETFILLEVDKISKSFNKSTLLLSFFKDDKIDALKNISFNLKHGETLGIIGESGCGKSTIARILVKLENPDKGKIFLADHDISEDENSVFFRKNIQLVFQNPLSSLNKIITIEKLLREPFETSNSFNKKEIASAVSELILSLGIDPSLLDRKPDQISGGEAQRIALARALALNPSVIIFDESLSALDRISQNEILILLREIQQKRKTSFIFISHDISLAKAFCDMILVLRKGEIIGYDIDISTQDPYVKSMINEVS